MTPAAPPPTIATRRAAGSSKRGNEGMGLSSGRRCAKSTKLVDNPTVGQPPARVVAGALLEGLLPALPLGVLDRPSRRDEQPLRLDRDGASRVADHALRHRLAAVGRVEPALERQPA